MSTHCPLVASDLQVPAVATSADLFDLARQSSSNRKEPEGRDSYGNDARTAKPLSCSAPTYHSSSQVRTAASRREAMLPISIF